jgi:hypothetical protein
VSVVLRFALVLGLIVAVACKRTADDAPPQTLTSTTAKPAPSMPPPMAGGRLAAAAAFDLIITQDGPLLAWAEPHAQGKAGAIVVRGLDAQGLARGPERRIATESSVIEVELAAQHDRVGLAFLESDASRTRTYASTLPLAGAAAPPAPIAIAESAPMPARGRGHIALAAVGDTAMRLMYPAGAADCAGADQTACIGFGFRELSAGTSEARTPWLSVPSPCPEGAASVASLAGRWFYAVCSWGADAPQTMAYSINTETYYARADDVLHGCTPLGMTALDDSTVLLGADCDAMRRAVRLTLDMRVPVELPLGSAALLCEASGPVIRAHDLSLPLNAPRDRLELVLPPSLAPTGARAVWTGRTLLVAHVAGQAQQLELVRYTCVDGALRAEVCAGCRGD